MNIQVLCSVSYYLYKTNWLLVSQNVYCVTPTAAPCSSSPKNYSYCTTLYGYSQKAELYFTSNTTLVFLPGDHALSTNITGWGAVGGAAGCRHLQHFTGTLHVATTGVNHRLVCKQCVLPEKVLVPLYWVLSSYCERCWKHCQSISTLVTVAISVYYNLQLYREVKAVIRSYSHVLVLD